MGAKNCTLHPHQLLKLSSSKFLMDANPKLSTQVTFGLKVKVKSLSRVQLFATPWAVVHQVPLSTGFSRQEHWSGVPLPSPPRI